jgi:hypothetical protein
MSYRREIIDSSLVHLKTEGLAAVSLIRLVG